MFYKRKAYDKLKEWKEKYAGRYAVLLEGARRVGKSTIALEFAKNEYKSYILVDFANANETQLSCFDDITDLNIFFLRIQGAYGVKLYDNESVIIFDEVQLFPKARQAIKYLVKDGRYHYIETGSLISIKKNVSGIVIPSEEKKISIYPMDYEEFLWATGNETFDILSKVFQERRPLGQQLNRKLMRDFRIYMAVGGMPQAVEAYIDGKNFAEIDEIKRDIIALYEEDFRKIDPSGKISMIYKSIPAQLSRNAKRFMISTATGKRKTVGDEKLLYDLIDSKTVLASYNISNPQIGLSQTEDINSYKLYLADIGLFVTLLFIDKPAVENELYLKLLSDKLPANLGYLYENAVAQIIASHGHSLYYHTWNKKESTHHYEIDFIISRGEKIVPIEVKSSGIGKHESLDSFGKTYSKLIGEKYIVSQKDLIISEDNTNLPVYMLGVLFIKNLNLSVDIYRYLHSA